MSYDCSIWWVAKDVCEALGLEGDPGQYARSLDDDEKGLITVQTLGGPQQMVAINEAGLYRLIFRSRKEEAKAFQRVTFHEVLPSIRKTGQYIQNSPVPILDFLRTELDAAVGVARASTSEASMARCCRCPKIGEQTLRLTKSSGTAGCQCGGATSRFHHELPPKSHISRPIQKFEVRVFEPSRTPNVRNPMPCGF